MSGSIYQEDKLVIAIYTPGNRAPKYMKQTVAKLKGETDNSTIILETSITHFQ